MFESEPHVQIFESLRGRLFGLAYRMLGSRADAEDVVQEAYLRWHKADRDAIRQPEAWLVTATTRIAIDRLRSLQTTRDAYSGPWLPEPLLDASSTAPDRDVELASDLSMAFLVLLEKLAPEERAAFLLHDVFDARYADIAAMLDKSEAACRQIVHRARSRVRGERRRFDASEEAHRQLLETFTAALTTRDEATLMRLFTADVTWTADGGGVVAAAPRPLTGLERVVRLALGLQRLYAKHDAVLETARINGEPGLILRAAGRLVATFAIDTDGHQISAVYVVLNPAKLPAA